MELFLEIFMENVNEILGGKIDGVNWRSFSVPMSTISDLYYRSCNLYHAV